MSRSREGTERPTARLRLKKPRWRPASWCPRVAFRVFGAGPRSSLVEGMAASTTRELDVNMSPQLCMAPGFNHRPTAASHGAWVQPQADRASSARCSACARCVSALPAAGASNPIRPASLLARVGLSLLPLLTPIPHATPSSRAIVTCCCSSGQAATLRRSRCARAHRCSDPSPCRLAHRRASDWSPSTPHAHISRHTVVACHRCVLLAPIHPQLFHLQRAQPCRAHLHLQGLQGLEQLLPHYSSHSPVYH